MIIKTEISKIFRRRMFLFSALLMIVINVATLLNSGLQIGSWYVIGFLVIAGLSPVFGDEYASGVDSLLLCCKNGRSRLVTSKIIAASLFTIAVTLTFICMDLIFILINNSAASLEKLLNDLPLIVTIKLIGAIGLGLLVLFLSAVSGSGILTLLMSGIILYLPVLISRDSYFYWLAKYSYASMMSALSIPYLSAILLVFGALSVLYIYFTYYAYLNHKILELNFEE